ncbi:MAG: F0F1 ATP synthase subunit B [Trebonia sp.]
MAQPHTVLAASNFLLPNATFIVEVIAFFLILGVLWKWVLPPVQQAMTERQATIRQQLDDAEAARTKLEQTQADYKKAMTEARTEAAQIRENARAEAQRTVDEFNARAQQESARIVARGEEQLASQRSAIVRELRGEIGSLAVELSEKIVEQRLADDANVRATVDSFLAELEQRDGAEASTTA